MRALIQRVAHASVTVDGTITGLDEDGLEKLRAEGIRISMDFEIGHSVDSMINGSQRIGQVIAETDSEEVFQEIEDRIQKCIFINERSLYELWEEENDK